MGGGAAARATNEGAIRHQIAGVQRVTWGGLLVNVGLIGFKFAAGVMGHSQALVADAVHSLSDALTDIVVLIGVRLWTEPPDSSHPYGHRRIETLITVIVGVALLLVGIRLGWGALVSLHSGERHLPGVIALMGALASILAKEWMFRWTVAVGRRLKSSAVIANAWHHRSDALSSVPVALAVGAALLNPRWAVLDQVGALAVTVFILYAAWGIVRPALAEMIDAGATPQTCAELERLALSVEGVQNVHKLRTRLLGGRLQVDLHVWIDPRLSIVEGHAIGHRVRDTLIADGPEVVDVLVHVEPGD